MRVILNICTTTILSLFAVILVVHAGAVMDYNVEEARGTTGGNAANDYQAINSTVLA